LRVIGGNGDDNDSDKFIVEKSGKCEADSDWGAHEQSWAAVA
jgi:hypothetical protein